MRGITVFDVLALLAVGAVVVLIAVPQRRVKRILKNEDAAVENLRDFEQRLLRHHAAKGRDTDGDGVAEFAPLGEVLAERAAEGRRVGGGDVWEFGGYLFQVLTPGPAKVPVAAGSDRSVTDYAEVAYLIAAWPAQPGETGMRAYLQSPFGILRHQIEGYPYDDQAPAPDWQLVRYEGARVVRGLPYQGNDWRSPAQDLRK